MNARCPFRLLSAFALALVGALVAQGADYAASLPTYLGRPGGLVPIPLTLTNASGVAGITAKVNYDPALLSVESVTVGELGAAFTLDQSAGDGVVTLIFTRAENLPNGQGQLGIIYFRVNTGATDALFSDLAIAEFTLGDSTGVTDLLANGNTLTVTPGKLIVSAHGWIDNDQDKLPDPWEALHGLSLLSDSRADDPDGDLLSNTVEYAFGANPNQFTPALQHSGTIEIGGRNYLTVDFPRLVGPLAGVTYTVRESTDLLTWTTINLGINTVATSASANGTETVRVRGDLPLNGVGATPRDFLRVDVTLTTSANSGIDIDQDNLPDLWETLHGLSLAANDSVGDPDADGLSNFAEYAFGSNPKQATASPHHSGLIEAAGQKYLTLAFPRLVAQTSVTYTVRESTNLLSWQTVNLVTNTVATSANGNETETVTVRGNLPLTGGDAFPSVFLRVEIAPAP